jgi:hypothetical protein
VAYGYILYQVKPLIKILAVQKKGTSNWEKEEKNIRYLERF